MLASTAFFAPIRMGQQLIDTLYLLDERLVSINKVLENADMSAVFKNATDSAYEYGQTIDGVLESLGEISKLGFNQQDAEFLNNQAMLLSTVGEFQSNADAANYLVAIMRQYKLEVQDTAQVVDALNNVSNKTGADTVSLSQGLSKASSSAAMAGVSFHELNGMIANTQEVLKITGNEAGTFYKTLFTRYLRPETLELIESMGISTKDASGELRSATDVLRDLGNAWATYDSQTQNAIASQLGGTWHVNKVTSLLENQDNVLKNIEFSMSSYGSATDELKTYEEGLQFQTNQMISSFQELAWTIGESGVRDLILALVNGVTFLTEGFTTLTEATDGWNIKLPLLVASIYGITKAVTLLSKANIGLKASFGWLGLGLVGLELGASLIGKATSDAVESTESLTKQAEKLSNQTKEIDFLVDKYEELAPQAEHNAEKQQELQEVLERIQSIAPHLIESTGQYGDALFLNKQKADEYIESLKTMTEEQVKQAQAANNIELSQIEVNIAKEQEKLNELDSSVKETFDNISKYQNKFNVSGILDAEEEFTKRFEDARKALRDEIENGTGERINQLNKELVAIKEEYDAYIEAMKATDGELGDYSEAFNNQQELEAQKQTILDRQKALDEYTNSVNKNTSSNDENAESLSNVKDGFYDLDEAVDTGTESLDQQEKSVDKLLESYNNATSTIEGLNGVINELNEGNGLSANTIGMIMEKYPQLLAYLNDETALRQAIQQEIANETNVALDSLHQKLMEEDSYTKSSQVLNSDFRQWLIDQYNIDLTSYKNLAKAKEAVDNELIKVLGNNWSRYYSITADGMAQIGGVMGDNLIRGAMQGSAEANRQLEQLYAQQQKYNNMAKRIADGFRSITLGTVNLGGTISSVGRSTPKSSRSGGRGGKGGSGSSAKERQVARYETDQYALAVDNLNLRLAQSDARLNDYLETSQAYRNELKTQISLHKEQQKLANNEISRLEKRNKSLKSQLSAMGNFNRLSEENKEKYNEIAQEIDNNIKEINQLKNTALDASEKIQDANEKIKDSYNAIADEIINVYKELIEVQRDDAIEAIEDELQAFEKAHQRKIEILDEELAKYQKIIDEQKKALEDQKDQEDHNKKMTEYNEELRELQKEYSKWSRDDSAYGQSRAKELEQQIKDLQEEILEYQRDRQYEAQQSALDDLLNSKQEQIENEKALEDQAYETGKEQLEREKEDTEQYYEDLLNDERAFNEMREQILAGHVNNVNNQLKLFSKFVQNNMQEIGKSISENLIDKIAEAQKLLGGISGGFSGGGSNSNLTSFLNALKSNGFDVGGRVSHDGFTYVHGGERVLDPEDNKNFERTMSFLDKAKSWMTPFIKQANIPKVPSIGVGRGDIHISMPINIANMNGTKQDAENVFQTINTKLTQSGILRKL